jgi:hypothetical protein
VAAALVYAVLVLAGELVLAAVGLWAVRAVWRTRDAARPRLRLVAGGALRELG